MMDVEEKGIISGKFPTTIYRYIINLKVREIIIILFFISVVLYLLNYVGSLEGASKFLKFFTRTPFPALADACLTSAIVGFTFELLIRNEADAGLENMLDESLQKQSLGIVEAIPKSLLLRRDVQRELVKGPKLEEVILSALQSRLLDDSMGEGIFQGIIRKAITYDEKWSNYRYEIFVEDILDEEVPELIRVEFFDVIMRISYDTELRKTSFRFTCAGSIEQFNNLMRSSEYEVKWLMPHHEQFSKPSEQTFQVLQLSVDDQPLPIRTETIDDRFEVICEQPDLTNKLGEKVRISYTFKVKAYKIGHMISTTVVCPTYDVTIEFNFAKASIDYVDVLDYFVSSRNPSIRYIPSSHKPYKITVELKEWAFPKGGAIFVWSLKEEAEYFEEKTRPFENAQ